MSYPVTSFGVTGMDPEEKAMRLWFIAPELLERLGTLTNVALKRLHTVGCDDAHCTFSYGRIIGKECHCPTHINWETTEAIASALVMAKELDRIIRWHFEPRDGHTVPPDHEATPG